MDSGYIKVYRTLWDKGYWWDSEYIHLWVHLLMKASYKQKEYLFNGKIEYLQPGQFITGRNSLVKETHINRSKIERILKTFENEHQIEQQTNNKFRIITILNWDRYQINEQQNEQPMSSQRAAREHKQERKKDKNTTYTPEFDLFWSAYPKRVGKGEAWKFWQRSNGDRPKIELIVAKIEECKKTDQWQKDNGQFIPNPSTWINQCRWDDDTKIGIVSKEDAWKSKIRFIGKEDVL